MINWLRDAYHAAIRMEAIKASALPNKTLTGKKSTFTDDIFHVKVSCRIKNFHIRSQIRTPKCSSTNKAIKSI